MQRFPSGSFVENLSCDSNPRRGPRLNFFFLITSLNATSSGFLSGARRNSRRLLRPLRPLRSLQWRGIQRLRLEERTQPLGRDYVYQPTKEQRKHLFSSQNASGGGGERGASSKSARNSIPAAKLSERAGFFFSPAFRRDLHRGRENLWRIKLATRGRKREWEKGEGKKS